MSDVTDGIRDYLASGGLFNPELMDHQRVRDLVIECRDEIERLRLENEALGAAMSSDGADACGALVVANAEIERLREECAALRDDVELKQAALTGTSRMMGEEIERLRGLVNACAIYLKEDETPAQRIERERADTDAVLKLLLKEKREVERLREQATQRGARMQVMREWMAFCPSGPTQNLWADFTYDRPEAVSWFGEDGAPR